jgi:multiple sugar transport system permease protein
MQRRSIFQSILIYTSAILVVIVTIFPLFWLFISSISTLSELQSKPVHWIPQKPTFSRYEEILTATGTSVAAVFREAMLNSSIIAASVTVVCVGIGSIAAYSFARMRFAKHEPLMYLMLFSTMLPSIAIVVPLYTIMRDLKLLNTLGGLIAIYSALIMPFAVWILYGYFQSIPQDLEDAARIDGCTRLAALVQVVLPLSAPGLVATALFSFLASWEEFIIALIFTSSPTAKTIPVAIAEFAGRHAIDYGMMATGGIIAAIPPILIALLFQRFLISGLTSGAVKG